MFNRQHLWRKVDYNNNNFDLFLFFFFFFIRGNREPLGSEWGPIFGGFIKNLEKCKVKIFIKALTEHYILL